jgi:hypothetical protein
MLWLTSPNLGFSKVHIIVKSCLLRGLVGKELRVIIYSFITDMHFKIKKNKNLKLYLCISYIYDYICFNI